MFAYTDEAYCNLAGEAGTVLCFHGAGGSARGWMNEGTEKNSFVVGLASQGFSIICPTARARNGKWSTVESEKNKDVAQVNDLIRSLVARGPFFCVGHSNGGGFASRFAVYGCREIAAVQYSNASGILKILQSPQYFAATIFAYSEADPVVDYDKIVETVAALELRAVPVEEMNLTEDYAAEDARFAHDHEFYDTSTETAAFFNIYT